MLGLRLDGLARDADGPLPDAFEAACRTHDVKAAYLCPNQHNPPSLTMPEARRPELAPLARRSELALIEDEPFGQIGSASGSESGFQYVYNSVVARSLKKK